MREPRVHTAKRTMVYMGTSLAFTASGLLLCYLLWSMAPAEGKTLNAALVERVSAGWPLGATFVVATLLSEAALLVVAAQTGFLDGPRVLANMAIDSWLPHQMSALSDRLTTQNGIVLMGGASLAALLYTRGDVRTIVVMYSINVFLTFSLSMLGMTRSWLRRRGRHERWRSRRTALFATGSLLCTTIPGVTVHEKFDQGGWITLTVTGAVVLLCLVIRRHYARVERALVRLYAQLGELPGVPGAAAGPLDPGKPTAAVLVASYGGDGIHTLLNIFRAFPGHFRNVVLLSGGIVDSGAFKGEGAIASLQQATEAMLRRYVELAGRLGLPATSRFSIGTDAVEEAERLCLEVIREFPRTSVFAGQVIFQRERWYQRFLHNETAFRIQKRLQWAGQTMVILPLRVTA